MQEVIGSTPIFSTQGRSYPGGLLFFPLPHPTYILYSPSLARYYVGHAEDPVVLLERDRKGGRNKSTNSGRPWRYGHTRWFVSFVA